MSAFIEFSEEHFPTMLKLLQHELPRSAMLYNVLRLKLSLEKTEGFNIRLFGYEEKPMDSRHREYIFIVALIRVQGLPQNLVVLFGPPNPSQEILESLADLIDWNQMNQFEGIESEVAEFIAKTGRIHGKILLHDPIALYFMEKSKALRFEQTSRNNEGILVTQLHPLDALKINDRWPAKCPGSLEMITASIKAIGSGGVYLNNKTGESGTSEMMDSQLSQLVSWAVALPFGSIHALHTEEQYAKRGFAGFTMESISKLVAESGRVPVVQIFKTNDTSKSVNERVGYVYSHDINLIHYYPY